MRQAYLRLQDDGTFLAQLREKTDESISDGQRIIGPGDSLFGLPFEELVEGWITEKE